MFSNISSSLDVWDTQGQAQAYVSIVQGRAIGVLAVEVLQRGYRARRAPLDHFLSEPAAGGSPPQTAPPPARHAVQLTLRQLLRRRSASARASSPSDAAQVQASRSCQGFDGGLAHGPATTPLQATVPEEHLWTPPQAAGQRSQRAKSHGAAAVAALHTSRLPSACCGDGPLCTALVDVGCARQVGSEAGIQARLYASHEQPDGTTGAGDKPCYRSTPGGSAAGVCVECSAECCRGAVAKRQPCISDGQPQIRGFGQWSGVAPGASELRSKRSHSDVPTPAAALHGKHSRGSCAVAVVRGVCPTGSMPAADACTRNGACKRPRPRPGRIASMALAPRTCIRRPLPQQEGGAGLSTTRRAHSQASAGLRRAGVAVVRPQAHITKPRIAPAEPGHGTTAPVRSHSTEAGTHSITPLATYPSKQSLARAAQRCVHPQATSRNPAEPGSPTGLHGRDAQLNREPHCPRAILGVRGLWVAEGCRRRGVARHLLDVARATCMLGHMPTPQEVVWASWLTEAAHFAAAYCGGCENVRLMA
jgi:hypothetical protein